MWGHTHATKALISRSLGTHGSEKKTLAHLAAIFVACGRRFVHSFTLPARQLTRRPWVLVCPLPNRGKPLKHWKSWRPIHCCVASVSTVSEACGFPGSQLVSTHSHLSSASLVTFNPPLSVFQHHSLCPCGLLRCLSPAVRRLAMQW